MATTTTITKLLIRRGNDADRKQTILASGEPGFALDTGRVWIGDGATPGGLPVISVADYHLHYIDDTGLVEGNFSRHMLDVNMPGLSATMAGDRLQPTHAAATKLFHPADRTLVTNYPIEINRDGSGNDLAFTGSEGDEFKITRTTPGVINIADVLKITIPADGGKPAISIDVQDGDFVLSAEGQKFAEGNDTLFEDKSTDYNVPMLADGTVLKPGKSNGAAEAATVENTGIYFAHMGVLSAGAVKVGSGQNFTSFNTLQLKPPVYKKNWTGEYPNLETRLSGTITVGDELIGGGQGRPPLPRNEFTGTNSWRGPIQLETDGVSPTFDNQVQFNTKPINIRSVRPDGTSAQDNYKSGHARSRDDCWKGDIDVILESGLIVYGPGDPDIQDPTTADAGLNGYLINQSVDSFAFPTFQGLRIEGPNAKPLNVKSGGTGRDGFDTNRLIMSHASEREGKFREFSLSQGKAIIGTTNGAPVQGGIEIGEESVYWTTSHNNNRLKFNTTFIPTTETAPGGFHNVSNAMQSIKGMFFDKFTYFSGDAGDAGFVPSRFDSKVKFTGDATNLITNAAPQGGSSAGAGPLNGAWDAGASRRPGNTIAIDHVEHAVAGGVFAKGTGTGDVSTITAGAGGLANPTDTQNDGRVLTSVTVNKGGHVRDLKSRNLDTRYAQLAHMGSKDSRSGGTESSPEDMAITVSSVGSNPINLATSNTAKGWLNNVNVDHDVQVIDSIDFNDYGTIKSITLKNLDATYYNRAEVVEIIDRIAEKIDAIDVRLDNDFFYRNKNSNSSGGAGYIETSWIYGSKVQFGSSNTANSFIKENSGQMEINSTKQIDFNTRREYDFNINSKNTLLIFQDSQFFYSNGGNTVKIANDGITLVGALGARQFKGQATYAVDSEYINVMEVGEYANGNYNNDPDWTLYPTFVIGSTDRNRSGTNSRTGYRQMMADSDLHYNPKGNYFGGASVNFIGNGAGLDMSGNTTIPSSIELETAKPNLFYNIVMSDNNSRENIYDKRSLAMVHSTVGTLLTRGDVIAFYDFSDARLKENVTALESKESLDKVLKLKPVSFDWKPSKFDEPGTLTGDPTPGKQIGLIAQDVEDVVPEVVSESARMDDLDEQYKRVDYEHLVPLLIASIKELNKKVEDLETKLSKKK